MNRNLIATLFFAVFLASVVSAATTTANVRLALDERSLLPGTPTGLSVVITNPGEQELQLPPFVWLIATNAAGQTFTVRASTMSHGTAGEAVPEQLRTVAPHSSRELRFDPIIGILGSPWFMDQRLWTPGVYRLRAVLASEVKPDSSFAEATALVSEENALTVALPSPEDAAVWEWMREQEWDEQSWGMRPWQLARFVNQNHPKSQYMLFTSIYLPKNGEGPSPVLIELVKRYPGKSFTDQVKLLIAQYYEQSESLARHQANLYVAANESDEARAIASDLVHNSRSSNVRSLAKELLDRIPTREQLTKKPEVR